jgi:hypothetical protein
MSFKTLIMPNTILQIINNKLIKFQHIIQYLCRITNIFLDHFLFKFDENNFLKVFNRVFFLALIFLNQFT